MWAGGAPVNDVSNIHGQGYADLHFLPVEIVREIVATPGTYDPRQGDFAVAGTLRFELGYDQPGITAKAQAGTFDTRRYFLAWRPRTGGAGTFAAAEINETQGFGPSRAAQRASAVAQVETALDPETSLRVMASAYTGHFASAGVLRLADVESGAVDRSRPTTRPRGRVQPHAVGRRAPAPRRRRRLVAVHLPGAAHAAPAPELHRLPGERRR